MRQNGQRIGFVPTMGALHAGHLSLVERAKREDQAVVVSIFVNPTQFNNASDLSSYPRTLESDMALLESVSTDILFAPSEDEIYPNQQARSTGPAVDLGALGTVMEGAHRPGHFQGVMQVVHRLFDIVRPDVAYFGEKDFQQLAVIRTLVSQLGLPVQIVGCPTCREEDGLAMSSRNVRLTAAERAEAPVIYRALKHIRDHHENRPLAELKDEAVRMIESSGHIRVEYLEVADAETLLPVTESRASRHTRSFIAANLGSVR
ncbi:MAG: pantoate--beta-alanine ligase, partial [Flavobacteriales bacterium]